MGKIILISFAFLAFAFYELSGGGDFVSIADQKRTALEIEQERTRITEAEAKAEHESKLAVVGVAIEPQVQPETTPLVLTRTAPTATQANDNDELQAAVTAALKADKLEATPEAEDVAVAVQIEEATPTDVREVTAARVNMRNGPGQSFDVLAKLTAGQQVEILQDPGDGWVKLRVLDNGRIGWMADFLLTASNN